jgi:hypothetical protein
MIATVAQFCLLRECSVEDGKYLVIKDEKKKEADVEVKQWLKKLKLLK